MNDATVIEAGAIEALDFSSLYFDPTPTDARFLITQFQENYVTNSLTGNAKDVKFELPALQANNVYLLNNAVLFIRAKLTKKDGTTVPDKGKIVGPINNTLLSMWWNLEIKLNTIPLNTNISHYPYRTYLTTLLSYSNLSKHSQLQSQQWYPEDGEKMNVFNNSNLGFTEHMTQYTKKFDGKDPVYRDDGTPMIGKLLHELSNFHGGIFSGIKININLTHADNSFRLLTEDTEPYKLVVTEAILHCPVGTLNPAVYERLEKRLMKEPTRILFQKWNCNNHPLLKGTLANTSDNIVTSRQLPSKIIVVFVSADAYAGEYKSNPFEFRRKWPITQVTKRMTRVVVPRVVLCPPDPCPPAQVVVLSPASTPGGSTASEPQAGPSRFGQLRDFLHLRSDTRGGKRGRGRGRGRTASSASSMTRGMTEDRPSAPELPPYAPPQAAAEATMIVNEETMVEVEDKVITGYCWITDVALTCGGSRIDSLHCDGDEFDAMTDFFRMNTFNNTQDSPFSNSVTYDDFRTGMFMCTFDLTTAMDSNTQYVVPSTRFGHLRLQTTFNVPTPINLEMLVFEQYPCELNITHSRSIGYSFLNTTAT